MIACPLRSPDFAPFLQRVRDEAPQVLFVFITSGSSRQPSPSNRGARVG